jgi:hypothetical protein
MRLLVIFLLPILATGCKDSGFAERRESAGTSRNAKGPVPSTEPSGKDQAGKSADAGKELTDTVDEPTNSNGKTGSSGSKEDDGKSGQSDDNGTGKKDNGKTDGKDDGKTSGKKPDVIVDSGTVEVGEDVKTGDKARLTLQGLRNDDGGVAVEVTREDGKVLTGTWPAAGQTTYIENACQKTKVKLKLKVNFRGRSFWPDDVRCMVGRPLDKKSLQIGFEEDCDSTDYNQIDDAIATWSCPESELTIEALRLDSSIDLGQWLK